MAPGLTAPLKEGKIVTQEDQDQAIPAQVVVADCRVLDTLATYGWLLCFQSISAGAAHDVDDLPGAGLPFNQGICQD